MNDQRLIQAAQAQDLNNLLDHIAWTDLLEPKLREYQKQCSEALVKSVLGQRAVSASAIGPQLLTSEQLAGRVDAINWLIRFMASVLKNGEAATSGLAAEGFHVGGTSN